MRVLVCETPSPATATTRTLEHVAQVRNYRGHTQTPHDHGGLKVVVYFVVVVVANALCSAALATSLASTFSDKPFKPSLPPRFGTEFEH